MQQKRFQEPEPLYRVLDATYVKFNVWSIDISGKQTALALTLANRMAKTSQRQRIGLQLPTDFSDLLGYLSMLAALPPFLLDCDCVWLKFCTLHINFSNMIRVPHDVGKIASVKNVGAIQVMLFLLSMRWFLGFPRVVQPLQISLSQLGPGP